MENTLLQINNKAMGNGDDVLGQKLIKNYFRLINEQEHLPRFITFYNSGVQLVCKESPVIDELKALEKNGVKLVVCKTCLMHFELLEKIQVGIVGAMTDIIELQKAADKVINL